MTYRMIFNQTGYFGRGAISSIPEEIAGRGLTRAFVVTDPVLADNGTAGRAHHRPSRCRRHHLGDLLRRRPQSSR